MVDVNLVYNPDDRFDDRSLIVIIMGRLGANIQAIEKHYGTFYRIHDWVYVLGQHHAKDRREPWYELKQKLIAHRVIFEVQFEKQEQKDKDGTVHDTDFCTEEMIYFITQYMPITERVTAVRNYLANAGVFVDAIRREPEKGVDATRESFRMQGKDEEWIDVRLEGINNRHRFTNILKLALKETISAKEYGTATDDLYIGLWRRTKEMLLDQMGLKPTENLRDNQSRLALLFEGIAEEVCSHYLGRESNRISWWEARGIIQAAANKVGQVADILSRDMLKDIPTDLPLPPGYEMPQIGDGNPLGQGIPKDMKTPRPITPRPEHPPLEQ
jgi:hypothetical protein